MAVFSINDQVDAREHSIWHGRAIWIYRQNKTVPRNIEQLDKLSLKTGNS